MLASIFKSTTVTTIRGLDDLDAKQRKALECLQGDFKDSPPEELLGVLKVRGFDRKAAKTQYQSTLNWRGQNSAPDISEVQAFLRPSTGCEAPDGCVFLLEKKGMADENGKPDCCRDLLGRPIIVSVGMLHGNALEMQRQMMYALNRAQEFTKSNMIHSSCTVIEVAPRKGANASFRFPDKSTKSLMELQKAHYPGTLSSTTHFCGIPSMITWAFALCKPFMDKEAYDNMMLKPDYSHLSKYIKKDQMLKEWGGEMDFDFLEYIEWRAEEEGVKDKLNNEVRRYVATPADEEDPLDNDDALRSMTSFYMQNNDPAPRKMHSVWKRGSGVGFFATTKWKEKLLCISNGSGFAVYFDALEISENNRAAKVIPLQGSFVEATKEGKDQNSFGFQLVCPGRSFLFSCESNDALDSWLMALQEEIAVANSLSVNGNGTNVDITESKIHAKKEVVDNGDSNSSTISTDLHADEEKREQKQKQENTTKT